MGLELGLTLIPDGGGDGLNRNSHEKELDVLIEREVAMPRRCEPGRPRPSYPALTETRRPEEARGRRGAPFGTPPPPLRASCSVGQSAAAKRVLTLRIRSGERMGPVKTGAVWLSGKTPRGG